MIDHRAIVYFLGIAYQAECACGWHHMTHDRDSAEVAGRDHERQAS